MHSAKVKKLQAVILKLDRVKYYDKVNWYFLRLIANWFKFEGNKLIIACVSSANYVMFINGFPTKFFKSSRGRRQGYSLSPLLFLMNVEGISTLILKEKSQQKIQGIKVYSHHNIIHQLFVDDVLLFGSGFVQEW